MNSGSQDLIQFNDEEELNYKFSPPIAFDN